jgi:glycosyltransferase involved in cell wall biosynthesis
MHVSLIIPAFNEADCLGRLLTEVPNNQLYQVIVVDNGSTDNTADVARAASAIVVEEPRRGYGSACAAGASVADGDVLVFMDGDGSFIPNELINLLAPFDQDKADLVLGARKFQNLQRNIMPYHQRFGNHLFAWLLSRWYGLELTDLGPFRAIRRKLLLELDMQEHTYGWPLEMIIKTAHARNRILELPVTYRPRFAGESKVGGTLRGSILTAYRFFYVMLRYAK